MNAIKRFWAMYKVQQKLYFRSPDVVLFGLIMPLVIFGLITMISGDKAAADTGLTYLQSAFVALSTIGICCTAFMYLEGCIAVPVRRHACLHATSYQAELLQLFQRYC